MISIPTTFVVGAGASVVYGLPVASQLRDQAIALKPGDAAAYQLLVQSGIEAEELNDILIDLRHHPAESIDAFLESRQDRPWAMQIGKALIATTMGVALKSARHQQVSREDDWLRYVIEKMRRGAVTWQQFADGNAEVRFVTFNFDTIIEDRLSRAVEAIYRGSNVDVGRVLERIPIIHVHGQLPPIPETELRGTDPFGNADPEWLVWTKQAASQINVVLEAIDETSLIRSAEAIRRAQILCFLGFAFDPDNFKRLELPVPYPGQIFGSAFGLLDGEQAGIRRRFPGNTIQLGSSSQGCCEVLRALDVFRD